MTDRRNALGLGLAASAVALSGRAAHAADALSIDAGGVKIDRPLKIIGGNTLEFGADVSGKQGDAGKIGYGVFENNSLCIVGAGTKGDNRKITFWAEGGAKLNGPLKIGGKNTLEFGSGVSGKHADAGKIGYGAFEGDSLCIIGAGTKDDNRKITFFAEGGAKFNGPMTISAKNTLEFGSDVSGKQGDAGKIGYGVFESDSLCIVGAGTKAENRKITFWAEGGAKFNGSLTVAGLSVPGAQEPLRMLRGVIAKDGSKFAGEGFTVTLVGPGRGFYDIVFVPGFPSIPAASATQIYQSFYLGNHKAEDEGGKTADNVVIAHLSADRMRVKTGDNYGAEQQRAFTFVVIGPR